MEGVIRNAIAAVAIIASLSVTLGTALVHMNDAIIILQENVNTLTGTVNELRCEIRPNTRGC